jgi:cytochrome c5
MMVSYNWWMNWVGIFNQSVRSFTVDKLEIRTGKHAARALSIAVVLLGIGLAGCSGKDDAETMSKAEIDKLIAPVGQLNTGAPMTMESPAAAPAESVASSPKPAETPAAKPAPAVPTTPTAARSGKQVYETTCFACHAIGAAGAPKFGDKAAWAPRIAQGIDTLLSHAVNGFQGKSGVMPPRGTCANCSDGELKAAIEYMVKNAS